MEQIQNETPELAELRAAQERLAAARQKVGEAETLKLQKAAADVAAFKAQQEAEIAERVSAAAVIEAKWAAKKKREEEAILMAQRLKQAQERELEQAFTRAEEEKRRRLAVQAEAQRLDDLAHQAEIEARRIAEEMARPKPKPTLADAVQGSAPEELSPELQNLLFRRSADANRQVYTQTTVEQAPPPAQQLHPQKYGVDQSSITELLDRWTKATRYSTRPDVIAKMLEEYGYAAVSAAINQMLRQVGEPPVRVGIGAQIGIVDSILLATKEASAT
jgi:hypothetical protein